MYAELFAIIYSSMETRNFYIQYFIFVYNSIKVCILQRAPDFHFVYSFVECINDYIYSYYLYTTMYTSTEMTHEYVYRYIFYSRTWCFRASVYISSVLYITVNVCSLVCKTEFLFTTVYNGINYATILQNRLLSIFVLTYIWIPK